MVIESYHCLKKTLSEGQVHYSIDSTLIVHYSIDNETLQENKFTNILKFSIFLAMVLIQDGK